MHKPWSLTLIASCVVIFSINFVTASHNDTETEDTSKFEKISQELNKVEQQIANMLKFIGNDDSSDKDFLTSLKDSIHNITDLKEDIKQLITNASVANSIDLISQQLESTPTLNPLDDHKDLDNDVVSNIRKKQFNQAEYLIGQMTESEVTKVVQDIYSPYTYILLLNFTKAVTRISSSYYILNEIFNVQQVHYHLDVFELMMLGRTTQSEVLKQPSNCSEIKGKAKSLYQSITDSLATDCALILTDAVRAKRYQDDHIIFLLNEVYKYSSEAFDITMEKFVNEAFKSLPAFEILESINSHSTDDQKVAGVTALFWKLQESSKHNKARTGVAWTLNTLSKREIYSKLTKSQRKALDLSVENIHGCLKFISPDRPLCIMNTKTQGYLSAANKSYNNDNQRRLVFTSADGQIHIGSEWFVQSYGGYAYFMNRHQHMEYLYASAVKVSHMRNVFTWIPGGSVGLKGGWDVELSDNYCFLKNAYFNEHIQASTKELESNMQLVHMSEIGSDPFGNMQALWEMKDCH